MATAPQSVYQGYGAASTASLVQKVELRVSCKNLPNMDVTSKSDPCAVLYFKNDRDNYYEFSRTEMAKNTLDPQFATPFTVDYHFETVQQVRIRVYDVDNSTSTLEDDDFLGQLECTLGQIVSLKHFTKNLTKKSGQVMSNCIITIDAEEVQGGGEVALMKWSAKKLDNKDFMGKSDPFIEISRGQPDGSWLVIHRTEVIKNDLNPNWRPYTLPLHSMFGPQRGRQAKFTVFDWDSDGGHDLIGSVTLTFDEFCKGLNSEAAWPCINQKKKAKKSSYKDSGTLILQSLKIQREYSFLDYLFGGLQMNLTLGVDFTASNGDPRTPSSLHYIDYKHPNEYMQAIQAVGNVLQDYDADKLFPALGFGAKIPPQMKESFEFALNFNASNPFCAGVEGVLGAYVNCVTQIKLWGPTNVAPVIQHVVRFAREAQAGENAGKGATSYFILLLLTDGVLSDMDNVRDTIVAASSLPLSLIIVGVGNADFKDMNILDGDDGVLKSSMGQPVQRDIVQFVPFRDFKKKSPAELASHVLAEIPKQVTGYYRMRGLAPNNQRSPPS